MTGDWFPTGVTVERFGPGEAPDPAILRTGDLILVRNPRPWWTKTGVVSAAIRVGQWRRYRHDKWAAWPNHVAIAVVSNEVKTLVFELDWTGKSTAGWDKRPLLIEALGHGVVRSALNAYQPVDYILVRSNLTSDQQDTIADFLSRSVGEKYGYLTIACEALICLFNSPIWFGINNTVICSGLAALGLFRVGWNWLRMMETVMPADAFYVAAGGKNPWPT